MGGVLGFIALSLSQFKLPHYLYVILPLFAVVAARGLEHARKDWAIHAQIGLVALLWCTMAYLVWSVFPEARWPFMALVLVAGTAGVLSLVRRGARGSAFALPFWSMTVVGVILNGYFYPNLLRYQANAKVGQLAAEQGLGPGMFYGLQVSGSAIDFYAGYPVPWLSDAQKLELPFDPVWPFIRMPSTAKNFLMQD